MDFYYFDPDDPAHGLDVPMISPHLIPEDKMQHWDGRLSRWVLIGRRSGRGDNVELSK